MSEPTTYPVHVYDGSTLTAIVADADDELDQASISRSGSDCTIAPRHGDSNEIRKGKHEVSESAAALLWNGSERRYDLRFIDSTYTFGRRIGAPSLESEGVDDGPDPNNPYDYRHYLDRPTVHGACSAALSAMSTPMHASTPYGSSPSILPYDTEARPDSSRGTPAYQQHAQGLRKPRSGIAAHPSRLNSAASKPRAPADLVIEDDSERPHKRQRLDAALNGESTTSTRDTSILQDVGEERSPPLDTGDLDSETGPDDVDDDIDELELPAPASGRPKPIERRKSVLDAEELEALYSAFEERPETEAAESHEHEAVLTESESEEE